jgi:hypothetical protein
MFIPGSYKTTLSDYINQSSSINSSFVNDNMTKMHWWGVGVIHKFADIFFSH